MRWTRQLARTEQIPTEDKSWLVWLYLAGRGAGKTRTAAEWLAWQASSNPRTRWAIAAPTYSDVRDTCAEGVSGIIQILREYGTLKDYNRSIGEIFLTNGSRIKLFSGEEPDRFRGPQFHGGWFDELSKPVNKAVEDIREVGRDIDDWVNEEVPGGWYTIAALGGATYFHSP